MTKYKVWAHVEQITTCNIDEDEYEDIGEPEELGSFETEEEAFDFVADLPTQTTSLREIVADLKSEDTPIASTLVEDREIERQEARRQEKDIMRQENDKETRQKWEDDYDREGGKVE